MRIFGIIIRTEVNKMKEDASITEIAERRNGIVLTSDVARIGMHRGSLKYLADKGELERVARGVYVRANAWADELFVLQSRFKRGIFSCETALFLHGLTDRTPESWTMTFPAHYNTGEVERAGVVCHQKAHALYGEGIAEIRSPYGCDVLCYSPEVTLCDILRPNNHVEIQQVMDAMRSYSKRPDRNLSELMSRAKQMRVEKRMRAYMEVLI